MMFIFGIVLTFVLLIVQTLWMVSYLRERLEIALPVCLFVDAFVLLFCGMTFHNLTIGIHILTACAFASFLFAIIRERNDIWQFAKERLLTPAFWAFAVGYVVAWCITYGKEVQHFDDFGAWASQLKQIVYYNRLFADADIFTFGAKNYPPGMHVIGYLFCYFTGGYSFHAGLAAKVTILLVCVLPLSAMFEKKDTRKTIGFVLLALLFCGSLEVSGHDRTGAETTFNNTLTVDDLLAAVSVCYLLFILQEKPSLKRNIYCTIIASYLCMVKLSGIVFVLIVVTAGIIVSLTDYVHSKSWNIGVTLRKCLLSMRALLPMIIPLVIALLYSRYASDADSITALTNTSIGNMVRNLTLNGTTEFNDTIRFSLNAIFSLNYTKSPIQLSCAMAIIVLLITTTVIVKLEDDPAVRRRMIVICSCLAIGQIIYWLAMMLSFYSIDSEGWASSFVRYFASYWGIGLLMSYAFILRCTSQKRVYRYKPFFAGVCATAFVLLFVPYHVYGNILPIKYPFWDTVTFERAQHKELLGKSIINDVIADINPDFNEYRYYLVGTGNEIFFSQRLMLYYLLPLAAQYPGPTGAAAGHFEPNVTINKEEWSKILLEGGYKYVFINEITEDFRWSDKNLMFDYPPDLLPAESLWEIYTLDGEEARLRHVLVEHTVVP
ncbi:MAG: hypothetical protein LBL96_12420 [Clostridiales bacterium]|jgi:hypothetical protein|nr:hypothetical protein [Clostridiales bacterium]